MSSPSIDDVLNKAFLLASFILGDRETSIRIVEEATARLNVTTAAQGKRLYYKPTVSPWLSSTKAERYRNKVLFSELHLLQRLIYIASEPAEKLKEQSLVASDAADEQMLIHFIKHLVRITTTRNSFYVTLGISRLLHNYTTAETMETFNAVIQDPGRVKDDYYYRSRKGVLMQELKKRFGSFLNVARGLRGEERFYAAERQGRLSDLVRECLTFFTPWDTLCLVPAGINPIVDGIPDLSSRSKQDEDKIEVDRIHAILHPDCYSRLVKLLGFDPPETRLEVPHFFLSNDNNHSGEGTGGQRRNPSNLSDNELGEIKEHLDDQSARRKRVAAGMLRILVDKEEQARLSPSRSGSARFELDHSAELIEVRSTVNGDDLLLASHLFTHLESANGPQPDVTSIVLEGGQKIAITVTPVNGEESSVVDVAYSETGLLAKASDFLRELNGSASAGQAAVGQWKPSRVPALAFVVALILLSGFGVLLFVRDRNSRTSSEAAITNKQVDKSREESSQTGMASEEPKSSVASSPSTNAPIERVEPKSENSSKTTQSRSTESTTTAQTNEPKRTTVEPRESVAVTRNTESNETRSPTGPSGREPDSTRSIPDRTAVVPLIEVKKIYVEALGDNTLRAMVREKIINELSASNRFSTSANKDDADALLKITVKSAKSSTANVSVRVALINARGEVIWSGSRSRSIYEGSSEIVAADIVKELLDDATAR